MLALTSASSGSCAQSADVLQDAVHRRQGLMVRRRLLGPDAAQAPFQRPAAERGGPREAAPNRTECRHEVIGQPKPSARRDVEVGRGDVVAASRSRSGEAGEFVAQFHAEAAEIGAQADAGQIRHAEVNIACVAIQPVGRDGQPRRQQEQFRRADRQPAAIIQSEQCEPKAAPGRQRTNPVRMAGEPGGGRAQQRAARRLAEQAGGDVDQGRPTCSARNSPRANGQPQKLALSGVTDCYQPIERKLQLTRAAWPSWPSSATRSASSPRTSW